MPDTPDARLLEQFARYGSEDAFTALVQRHIGLVHSVALRHTADPQHGEDITQAVFIILARKAGQLGPKTVLPGWLYHTARLTAANWQRAEARRVRREQEAFMRSQLEETPADNLWRELSPQLDLAMAGLGRVERDALVLRYFQNKCLAEVGQSLGLTENAAQKRVHQALEKLRRFFSKRGEDWTASRIADTLSTHSIQAAPAALAKSVAGAALAKGATASVSTLTLVKGALKIMAWTKTKTTIIAAAAVILAATTGTIAVKAIRNHAQAAALGTRVFKLNADTIANLRLTTRSAVNASPGQILPDYLRSKGADTLPPTRIFYNESRMLFVVRSTASNLDLIERIISQLGNSQNQIHIKTDYLEVAENDVPSVMAAGTALSASNDNPLEIMDADKARQLFGLLRSHGARTLARPEVVTLFNRQSRSRAGDVTADLIPTLLDDGYAIKMKVAVQSPQRLTAEANLWDGQTLALGSPQSDGQTRLFVFVTVRMVDPAGNAAHSQADLLSKLGTIPPQ